MTEAEIGRFMSTVEVGDILQVTSTVVGGQSTHEGRVLSKTRFADEKWEILFEDGRCIKFQTTLGETTAPNQTATIEHLKKLPPRSR